MSRKWKSVFRGRGSQNKREGQRFLLNFINGVFETNGGVEISKNLSILVITEKRDISV